MNIMTPEKRDELNVQMKALAGGKDASKIADALTAAAEVLTAQIK